MDEIKNERGGVSVSTENIFPVIKQWLYSEKEIFLRELVSNACDAVTKHKRLVSLSETADTGEPYKITVRVDKALKTITVSDNGIGMSADEIKKYICQIALSGALDFIEKYEGKDASGGIIGHFGLGFYSAFMVADTVDVISRSYRGDPAVKWVCQDAGDYEFSAAERSGRGTDIVLHVNSDNEEYLSDFKLKEILNKYCAFMPVPIFFESAEAEAEAAKKKAENKDGEKEKTPEEPKPINDTCPLWLKNPSDCTEEEYKEFYQKVFNDYREPLFHIHINADYPLNFKGILYFPRLNHEFDSMEGQVKLYYNQVFVADNIKEVIPEYMLMLKGVLDCPDMPLNVSRSYLQNNGYVSKITAHIVKKVTDKLNSLMNTEREKYEKLWKDIKLFVEYACLRDRKFYDRVKASLLLEKTDGKTVTVDEYLENAKAKHENVIYYTSDAVSQAQYLSMFDAAGIEVVVLDKLMDTQFVTVIEQDRSVKFTRIDSEIASALKGDGEKLENKELCELFKKVSGNEKLNVVFEALKDESVPALLNVSEESRRLDDMMKMYSMGNGGEAVPSMAEATLVLNSESSLVKKLIEKPDEGAAKQLYTLTLLSQRRLTAEELRSFLKESFTLLEKSF